MFLLVVAVVVVVVALFSVQFWLNSPVMEMRALAFMASVSGICRDQEKRNSIICYPLKTTATTTTTTTTTATALLCVSGRRLATNRGTRSGRRPEPGPARQSGCRKCRPRCSATIRFASFPKKKTIDNQQSKTKISFTNSFFFGVAILKLKNRPSRDNTKSSMFCRCINEGEISICID